MMQDRRIFPRKKYKSLNSLLKNLEIEKKAFEFQHNVVNKRSDTNSDLSDYREFTSESKEKDSASFNTDEEDEDDYEDEDYEPEPIKKDDKFFGRRSTKTRGVKKLF